MTRYLPPSFPLHEFDGRDHGAEAPDDGADRRWFGHWDGPVGSPAEEVTLGWSSSGGATVLVCSSGRDHDRASARFRAAHLALGGTALPIRRRPGSAEDIGRELERLSTAGEAWSAIAGLLPGGSGAEATVCDGYSLAYCLLAHGALFIAAVGVPPSDFAVRPVRDWAPYGVDATREFTPSSP